MKRSQHPIDRFQANTKVTFNRWRACDRCGFEWPERSFRKQFGIRVCPECYDELGHKDNLKAQEPRDAEGLQSSPWVPDEEDK